MIKLKNTPEQVELVKAIGSRDPAVSRPAAEAYAAAIGPVIKEVLLQAGTASLIYKDYEFNEDDVKKIFNAIRDRVKTTEAAFDKELKRSEKIEFKL